MYLKFKCPVCGKKRLHAVVLTLQTVTVEVMDDESDHENIVDECLDYDSADETRDVIQHFQCAKCGYKLINEHTGVAITDFKDWDLVVGLKEEK